MSIYSRKMIHMYFLAQAADIRKNKEPESFYDDGVLNEHRVRGMKTTRESQARLR